MKIFSLVEGLLLKLSVLPGLGFLNGYVREYYSRLAGIQSKTGRYQGYVSTVRGAGADVAQAARGSKQEEAEDDDDDIEEEEDDDIESFMQ